MYNKLLKYKNKRLDQKKLKYIPHEIKQVDEKYAYDKVLHNTYYQGNAN